MKLLIAPAIIYIVAMIGAPFVLAILYSLSDATTGDPSLHLVGLRNFGAALEDPVFRLALRNTFVFTLVSQAIVIVLSRMSRSAPAGDRFRQLALGLVAGGAAGNLIDRIRSARGVVDFLDVGIGALRWPTFNVADIAVSCGAIALAISLWREDSRRPETESASAA